ncbi:MAG TPA: hypothetical protein VM390_12900 [Acidimicrobiales bacterium]|jgi:hypothetical protein|nr:hypothetical protein [Acidimicrobiales bacterium]
MSEQTAETSASGRDGKPAAAAAAPMERRVRRTTLSTGFSDVPGRTCPVCGYEGFRWQATCPKGHPLG